MNLLSLGMPMDQPPTSQPQPQSMSMHQGSLPMSHSNSGSHDAAGGAPALAAWLEGFDQRTGLPRRSSVDPIEEEEHESGEEARDVELEASLQDFVGEPGAAASCAGDELGDDGAD